MGALGSNGLDNGKPAKKGMRVEGMMTVTVTMFKVTRC